jgi:hypothetical protein
MSRLACLSLPVVALSPSLWAQEHKIEIQNPTGPVTYTIETTSQLTTDRKVLIDGEERAGGGRGGNRGAGPTAVTQKLVIEEGDGWRMYHTAEGTIKRGWDGGEGEPTKVTDALAGKRVSFKSAEAAMVVDEKGGKVEDLPANVTRDVPRKIDLSGLAPNAALQVDGTYDVSKGLAQALKSLAHPVRAPQQRRDAEAGEEQPQGERRRRRNRDAGGEEGGGGEGGGGAGGGGGGGGPGGFRMPQVADNSGLRAAASPGVKYTATGKLVGIETIDGAQVARIAIEATIKGEGDPRQLGLGMGMGGRFGGGGGGGGGGAADMEASGAVNMDLKGTLLVDVARKQPLSLELKGDMQSKSQMSGTFREQEMESTTESKGTVGVKVVCAPSKS